MFKDKEVYKELERLNQRNDWRRDEIDALDTKLNLILSHLNLEYVPETTKNEPAKLVTKDFVTGATAYPSLKIAFLESHDDTGTSDTAIKPKKKRGRPKKK